MSGHPALLAGLLTGFLTLAATSPLPAPTDRPPILETLEQAKLLLDQGEAARAVVLLEESLEALRGQAPDDPPSRDARDLQLARALVLLTVAWSQQGETSKPGLEVLQEAFRLRQRVLGPEDPLVAETLSDLGAWSNSLGDYGSARPFLERSVQIYEASPSSSSPGFAEALTNLSYTDWATGNQERALRLMTRVLEIREKTLAPEDPELASTLANLGYLYQSEGELERARPLIERALGIQEKALGPRHLRVADTLNILGNLNRDAGHPAQALALFQRALSIRQEHMSPEHPLLAQSFAYLATVHLALGQPKAALPLMERALRIQRQALGENHPAVTQAWLLTAQSRVAAGRIGPAFDAALTANQLHDRQVSLTVQALPEWHSVLRSGLFSQGLDLALTMALHEDDPDSTRRVWSALIPSRALILDEIAERRHILHRTSSPELEALWTTLDEARQELARLSLMGPRGASPSEHQQALEAAQAAKDRAETALARKSADFAHFEASEHRPPLDLDDLAAALPDGAALVSFVLYHRVPLDRPLVRRSGEAREAQLEARYAAFVLPSSLGAPHLMDLGSAEEIETLVGSWRERMDGYSEDRYQVSARLLRQVLWDPIERQIGKARRVFLVPDGEIHRVSFASLPEEDGTYLLEGGPLIHLLSTERELLLGTRRRSLGQGLLTVGGPDFDASSQAPVTRAQKARPQVVGGFRGAHSSCGPFSQHRFTRLPGAEAEAEEILALWQETEPRLGESLVGTAASETAVRQRAPGRRMLHLATHGFLLGEECPSFLTPSAPESRAEVEDPLLLSGLALAGANHRQEASAGEDDGILTAEEIASLDLTGVEWVVLSGCDTGAGPIAEGEGVLGLRRAFRAAGARSLILSLWKVEDQSTREWMRELYCNRLERGMGTAEAVRAASLAVLERRRRDGRSTHPFHWAAFVAEGDWR